MYVYVWVLIRWKEFLPYILTAFGSSYRNEVTYLPKGPNSHDPCSWGKGFLPEKRAGWLITPAAWAPRPEDRWCSGKDTGLRVRGSGLWFWILHPLPVKPQASLLASLNLSLFICTMKMMISSLPTSQGCCKDQITDITQLCIHWVKWYANIRERLGHSQLKELT